MSWVAVGVAGATLVGGVMSSNASQDAADTQAKGAKQASNTQLGMFQNTQANMAPWLQAGNLSLDKLQYLMGIGDPMQGARDQAARAAGIKKPTMQDAEAEHLQSHIKTFGKGYTVDSDQSARQAQTKQIYDRMLGEYNQQLQALPNVPTTPGADFGSLTKPFSMQDFQASPAYQFNLEEGTKAINKASAARGKFYAPSTLQDISKYSQGLASNEFQNAYSNYNTNLGNIWNRLSTLSGSGQNAAGNLGTNATQVAGQVGNNITGGANAQAAGQVGSANALNSGMGNAYNAYLMQQILGQNQQSTVPGGGMGAGIMPGAGDIGAYTA